MSSTRTRAAKTLVAVAAIAVLAAACGSPSAPTDPQTSGSETPGDPTETDFAGQTLTVWFPGTNQAEMTVVSETIIPAFEDQTGASVDVTFVDWGDISPMLNTGFAAGTAPDLFGHGPAAQADFVAHDRLEPLDQYFAALDPADVEDLEAATAIGIVDGTQYMVPLSLDGNLILYRADLVSEGGYDPDALPDTWEGIYEIAQDLTTRGSSGSVERAGLLLPTSAVLPQQVFGALIAGAGGAQISDDGSTAAFNSEAGVRALSFYTDLFTGDAPVSSYLGEDYYNLPVAQQPLVTGTAVFALHNASMAGQIAAANPDLDLRVLQPLRFETSSTGAAIGGGGPGLMMNADSDVKELAWAFIEFLISDEYSLARAEAVGFVPMRASQASSAYVSSSPVVQAFIEAGPLYVANPNIVGWVQVRDTLVPHLELSLRGQATPQEALEAAEQDVNSVLGSR